MQLNREDETTPALAMRNIKKTHRRMRIQAAKACKAISRSSL